MNVTQAKHRKVCLELTRATGAVVAQLDALLENMEATRVTGYIQPAILAASYKAAGRKVPT